MHLIAAHSRFCAIEQARAVGLRAPEWAFVTDEWVLKGRLRLDADKIGSDTLVIARCWTPSVHEADAAARYEVAGATIRRTHCGGAR